MIDIASSQSPASQEFSATQKITKFSNFFRKVGSKNNLLFKVTSCLSLFLLQLLSQLQPMLINLAHPKKNYQSWWTRVVDHLPLEISVAAVLAQRQSSWLPSRGRGFDTGPIFSYSVALEWCTFLPNFMSRVIQTFSKSIGLIKCATKCKVISKRGWEWPKYGAKSRQEKSQLQPGKWIQFFPRWSFEGSLEIFWIPGLYNL